MSLTFKRHYHLIVLLALTAVMLVVSMGDQPIIAYTLPGYEQVVEQSIKLTQGEIAFFLVALGIH